jgi:hypothetical protein
MSGTLPVWSHCVDERADEVDQAILITQLSRALKVVRMTRVRVFSRRAFAHGRAGT